MDEESGPHSVLKELAVSAGISRKVSGKWKKSSLGIPSREKKGGTK
jgi:hypothetical protein